MIASISGTIGYTKFLVHYIFVAIIKLSIIKFTYDRFCFNNSQIPWKQWVSIIQLQVCLQNHIIGVFDYFHSIFIPKSMEKWE